MEKATSNDQKSPTSPIADTQVAPTLGDEGGSGLKQVPTRKPGIEHRFKQSIWVLAGMIVALMLILPLSRFEPETYIAAIVIALAAIPLSAMFAKRQR